MRSEQVEERGARERDLAQRPDGRSKAEGRFAFSSDLWVEGMAWGAIVRSHQARARIRSIDVSSALAIPGVHAIVTAEDVPGNRHFGVEVSDQPVFAYDQVRFAGEPIAAVAASHPDIARAAAAAVDVDLEPLAPLVDPDRALDSEAIHPDGNIFRELHLIHGDPDVKGDIVVSDSYEVGMQDQAFLGPESGLAFPTPDGGLELFVSSQWLHSDRRQIAACLDLPAESVILRLAGVGGAFGGKEDLNVHIPLALLALKIGRPVKIVYSREESFHGHVHRHPARLWYRHHADRSGRLVKVEARIMLDGGAYASTSKAVLSNAVCFGAGPYRVPNAVIDGWVVRTNNPPCGAMRGFGAVQACFAYESQMDRLASELGMDPVDIRLRNAVGHGDAIVTGQQLDTPAPVTELLSAVASFPLPEAPAADWQLPGATGRTPDASRISRGVGYATGFKNLMFSEGHDDSAAATVSLKGGVVTIRTAAAELGQGVVTIARQIAGDILGSSRIIVEQGSTEMGNPGSSSASRQTWMSGAAIAEACEAVKEQLLEAVRSTRDVSTEQASFEEDVIRIGAERFRLEDISATDNFEASSTYHHRPTSPLDEHVQGDAHVSFAFVAHRAVVDVDLDLGIVKVVEVCTAQDVGRVLNPLQLTGQIEGGISQGIGLATLEEIQLEDGVMLNPSFTDYLIPTIADSPPVQIAALVQEADPHSPLGAKGAGESPSISSTAAVAAAIRQATGLRLTRVPIRPEDLTRPSER